MQGNCYTTARATATKKHLQRHCPLNCLTAQANCPMYQPPPPMTKGGALSLQGLIGNSDDHTCTATTQSNCYTTAHATGLQVVSNCCPSQVLADCSPTVCTMDCTLRQPFNNDSTCYETTARLLRLQANCHDTAHGTARDTSQTTLHCTC